VIKSFYRVIKHILKGAMIECYGTYLNIVVSNPNSLNSPSLWIQSNCEVLLRSYVPSLNTRQCLRDDVESDLTKWALILLSMIRYFTHGTNFNPFSVICTTKIRFIEANRCAETAQGRLGSCFPICRQLTDPGAEGLKLLVFL
jgi:hypothetical protein